MENAQGGGGMTLESPPNNYKGEVENARDLGGSNRKR